MSTYYTHEVPWKVRQICKLLSENNVRPKTICDVGCGHGEVLSQLHAALGDDITYTGYDISPSLKKKWAERTNPHVTYICKDFLSDENFFDVICVVDVLEHVEDYMGFLRGIKGRAEYKVFAFPLEISVLKVIFAKYFGKSYERYGHFHFFSKESAEIALRHTGFEIVDSILAPASVYMAGKTSTVSRASSMLRIPRKIFSIFGRRFSQKLLGGYAFYVLAK